MTDHGGGAGRDLWVVVPGYNEAAWIGGAIDGLAAQEGAAPFTVLVVDNASTDDTAGAARVAAARHPDLDVRVLREDEKGTGAASDSGFRHAIARGATFVLRTDADCVPDPDWVATMRGALEHGPLDLVAGNLRQRTDDGMGSRLGPVLVPAVLALIRFIGRVRPNNNDNPDYRGPFVVTPGANLGIRAETYLACGGFPRTSIEEAHEDKEIVNRVRLVSDRIGFCRESMVRFSNRRVARNGLLRVLRWYFNHGGGGAEVDVR
ncbi:MAG: AMP-dependent synthetase and ligase [Thermoleophilia bacterium]|nr:AMP-dependent synthetase and ligase [Thermoleophilia bacterium]